jgi:hypothetical protein
LANYYAGCVDAKTAAAAATGKSSWCKSLRKFSRANRLANLAAAFYLSLNTRYDESMTMTTSTNTTPFAGIPVTYYLPRLDEADLHELRFWARYCYRNNPVATKFGAYLDCLASIENERRELLESGAEVLEVSMPEIPCHAWSNPEVVAGLSKAFTLVRTTDGEIQKLMDKLAKALLVEASVRLDPDNIAGQ